MMQRYSFLFLLLLHVVFAWSQTSVDTISFSKIDTLNTQLTDSLARPIHELILPVDSSVAPVDSLVAPVDSLVAPVDSLVADSILVDSLAMKKEKEKEKKKKFHVHMDTLAIIRRYEASLKKLLRQRDETPLGDENGIVILDPYFYQLISVPALYHAPTKQAMDLNEKEISDPKMLYLQGINRAFAKLYVTHPWLVRQTEDDLRQQGLIREDVAEKLHSESNLAEKVKTTQLMPEMSNEDKINVKTRRPNFWKFPGSSSLGFTQNYYSDNWGADNKYSGTVTLVLNANYDDTKKLIWSNNLDLRLGFQTNKSDKMRTFRPTTNRIVYNTNAGYKAIKSWYYSLNVNIETKLVPEFQTNTDNVLADIFSPMEVKIAPGMTYDFKYGKNKKFTGKLTVAPLAYNIMYVQRNKLVTRYGVEAGHHSRHTFGPTARLNFNFPITKQISWSSTLMWYSDLSRTQIDWSNTFNFSINKYMSARLFIHPIFDDNSRAWKGKWDYLRMEESFTLNMNYSF